MRFVRFLPTLVVLLSFQFVSHTVSAFETDTPKEIATTFCADVVMKLRDYSPKSQDEASRSCVDHVLEDKERVQLAQFLTCQAAFVEWQGLFTAWLKDPKGVESETPEAPQLCYVPQEEQSSFSELLVQKFGTAPWWKAWSTRPQYEPGAINRGTNNKFQLYDPPVSYIKYLESPEKWASLVDNAEDIAAIFCTKVVMKARDFGDLNSGEAARACMEHALSDKARLVIAGFLICEARLTYWLDQFKKWVDNNKLVDGSPQKLDLGKVPPSRPAGVCVVNAAEEPIFNQHLSRHFEDAPWWQAWPVRLGHAKNFVKPYNEPAD